MEWKKLILLISKDIRFYIKNIETLLKKNFISAIFCF